MATQIAAELDKAGRISLIDAPVSGGTNGAEKGTLAVMVSGDPQAVESLRPALSVFGKIFVCGDKPGMGQTMKLANNMIAVAALAISSEAMAMGAKAGLDPQIMIAGGTQHYLGKDYNCPAYGADALRYTLLDMTTEGQDLKLNPGKFETGRNFANKMWNAGRFLLTNLAARPLSAPPDAAAALGRRDEAASGGVGEAGLQPRRARVVVDQQRVVVVEVEFSALDRAYQRILQDVANHPEFGIHQMSMSYGLGETFMSSSQLQTDAQFFVSLVNAGVTPFASSGDAGATPDSSGHSGSGPLQVEAPASDVSVTGVGGTSLTLASNGSPSNEKVWNDTQGASGGGVSSVFNRPSWQNGVAGVTGGHRGVPDISMSAACDGAVQVYSSYTFKGWSLVCGTSEATPEFAGVVAIADQIAGHGLGDINPGLYKLAAVGAPVIVDVTSGNNTVAFLNNHKLATVKGYTAGAGYDLVTGVGTPDALALTYELAGKG